MGTSKMELPPFPVDDVTLDLLMSAIDPWSHGDPGAERSSLSDVLEFMSRMGGSDPSAVEDVAGPGRELHLMRDPQYTDHCVIAALVTEVRRLRVELAKVS